MPLNRPGAPALPLDDDPVEYDLTTLCGAAEPWLAMLTVSDGRVQAAPDARTVRYYQSTGLLDRPVRYDGRVARYGRRHLLQLLAIRTLQSNGLSLAQVQAMLGGATNEELAQTVESAIDGAPTARVAPEAVPAPSPSHTPLSAFELAPGVVVTIDSRFHHDAARTIEVLRRALTRASQASNDVPQGDIL